MIIQASCHYLTNTKHQCCILVPAFYSCFIPIPCILPLEIYDPATPIPGGPFPPKISVISDNPYTLPFGTIYTDPGATAFDNEDGDITLSIVRTGHTDVDINAGVAGNTFTITYTVTDSDGMIDTVDRIINITVVNQPPVITITGTNPFSLPQHSVYVDQGATALDPEDGNLTTSIVRTGHTDAEINAGVDGDTFTITYTVTDSEGLTDTEDRVINIIAPLKPVITIVGDNPYLIMEGTAYIDPGATAVDGYTTDITTNIVQTGATPAQIQAGVVGDLFYIYYNVVDQFGTAADQKTRTVKITVKKCSFYMSFSCNDTVKPIFTDVNLTGTGYEKSNDGGVTWTTTGTIAGNTGYFQAGNWLVQKLDGPLNFYEPKDAYLRGTYYIGDMVVSGCGSTSAESMFDYMPNLLTIDVTGFDTGDVTSMRRMFGFTRVPDIDVSGFDTSNVTDMFGMFDNEFLTSLDVSGFDTSQVTNMAGVFANCESLTSLDVFGFDTSNVTTFNSMFSLCKSIDTIDVSGFDTSNVTVMKNMFDECYSVTSLDVSGFDTSNVIHMSQMFNHCRKLTSLDLSNFNTNNVTEMDGMFAKSGLIKLDLSSFNYSKCTHVSSMNDMFRDCPDLRCISKIYTSQIVWHNPASNSMFDGCPVLSNPSSTKQSQLDRSPGSTHSTTC